MAAAKDLSVSIFYHSPLVSFEWGYRM